MTDHAAALAALQGLLGGRAAAGAGGGPPGMSDGETPAAVAVLDANGLVTLWTPGAEGLLGHRAGEVVGHPLRDLIAEADPSTAADRPSGAVRPADVIRDGAAFFRCRDGGRIAVHLAVHNLPGVTAPERPDPAGKAQDAHPQDASAHDASAHDAPVRDAPAHVDPAQADPAQHSDPQADPAHVDPAQDSSARDSAAPAVPRRKRAAPRRLVVITPRDERVGSGAVERALRQLPIAAAVLDTDLRYVWADDEAGRLWARSVGEMIGRRPSELSAEGPGADMERLMRRAVETGEQLRWETGGPLPGVRDRVWVVVLTPLTDAAGRVRGLTSLGVDITDQHRARTRLLLSNQAAGHIGSTLDVDLTAQELAEALVPAMADFVTVDLLVSALGERGPRTGFTSGSVALRRVAYHSALPGSPESVLARGETETHPADSVRARVMATGDSMLFCRDAETGTLPWEPMSEERRSANLTYDMHSVMVVPMAARGATLGVAVFSRHRSPEPFADDDLLLAEEITARAAVSLDNALRYTRERDTALTLQNSLLPRRLPHTVAVDVAGRYLPADERLGVGGDWCEVIPLSGARVALVAGDVVGHGVRASAAMGRMRATVRALADLEPPPGELLSRLDDIVTRPYDAEPDHETGEAGGDTGATCLYVVYDPVSRLCTIASAGHPPPVLIDPDGTARVLDVPPGPPLGLGGLPFEHHEVLLAEGSLLALYTDGLVERRDRDIDVGIAELVDALSASAGSPRERCDAVLAGLLPQPPEDDVALLIARSRALDPAAVATYDFPPDPAAVAAARNLTAGRLAVWGLDELAFTTEIVVSELITNAIRHASGPLRLRLILAETLIVEVSDRSSTFPQLRRARTDDEGGRGLMLVARLSRRWGTRPTDSGKVIWADQSLPDPHGD
ncbi:SpoIIE family protein phosphatase [Streptantibioticus silvisoli]|uniref:SpoIIE family protein phosphatase n=1 Tax=Streptantibioticus silvisoli TaxID=2705255 RepID=A0ABT6W125_9ACTN|nr:SpoIIE family protein phosphatase [Streptantibioticus silvisoli]MDI5964451.1 SpoIIE family protein phosphatase [Streptantibioticus silvisoli]